MSDGDALLKAILLHPEEDTPRLVYADWLDEHGESERAEFIRVQIELASRKAGRSVAHVPAGSLWPPSLDGGELAHRERELFTWHNIRAWFTHGYALRHFVSREQYEKCDVFSQVLVARGFFSELTCDATTFLRNADALVWHPTQTVVCPECRGQPEWENEYGFTCDRCGDSGRVPRPCPPTAQPIRRVTLTTLPGPGWYGHDYSGAWIGSSEDRTAVYPWPTSHTHVPLNDYGNTNYVIRHIFSHRWPGVTFELPVATY